MAEKASEAGAPPQTPRRPSFARWLLRHHLRQETAIGDLARDVKSDRTFPYGATTFRTVESYLSRSGACGQAMEAFYCAWREYADALPRTARSK